MRCKIMANKKSWKGKGSYAEYKTDGRALKNKIKKLERHCKRFPNDEVNQANLAKAKNGEYVCRAKPFTGKVVKPEGKGGITQPKVKYLCVSIPHIKTPGEQLSELLGILLPKPRRKFKPKITHKPRRK